MKWFVVAVALALAGCGGSPKTHFYTLVPEAAAHQNPPASHAPPLQVGRVALPGTLDRAAMVTLGPGTAVSVSDQDRWSAPLNELVRRTLTADLRQRLGDTNVLDPGDPAPPHGVRMVVLNVQQFGADSAGQVVLTADWTVARLVGGKQTAQAPHTVTLHASAGSTHGAAVSAAMSKVLGELADRIAGSVS